MEDNPENQKPYKSQTSEARSRGINNINGTSSKFAGILMSTKTNVKYDMATFSIEEKIEAFQTLRDIQLEVHAGKSLEEVEEDGFQQVTVFSDYNGKRPPFILHQSDVGMHLLAFIGEDGFCNILEAWPFTQQEKLQEVSWQIPKAVKLLIDKLFMRNV